MNRIQLAKLRDIAIEYLPAAQQYREEVKARPAEERESQGYARALWRIADETIARHEATGEELAAACLLHGLMDYELYDPSDVASAKLYKARGIDTAPEKMRDAMLQGIANAVKTLANVTGRDIPMVDPVAYFVDPAIAAMPAMEQIELSLADVVRISEAAPLIGCTVESLLRQAANDERLLYVALKPHFQTLSAIPSHPNPKQGTRTANGIMFVAMMSRDAVSLATIGSAEISQYQASFGGVLDWHYWMLDVPQTVGVDMIYVPRSQLPAHAPAGKVEAEPVATPAPAIKTNKLRHNSLDPAIDEAIKQAGSDNCAAVYLKLKAMALNEEMPFTGVLNGNALCYTDDNNQPAELSKGALGKRLKRR
ncbi:MAG: hypothetical protein WAW10_02650 [Gallionella sp.]